MIRSFHRILNFILIFSSVLGGWTAIVLLSNTNFNNEIKTIVNQMYLNQKGFILNVKELSLLLVKDANTRFDENYNSELNNNIN